LVGVAVALLYILKKGTVCPLMQYCHNVIISLFWCISSSFQCRLLQVLCGSSCFLWLTQYPLRLYPEVPQIFDSVLLGFVPLDWNHPDYIVLCSIVALRNSSEGRKHSCAQVTIFILLVTFVVQHFTARLPTRRTARVMMGLGPIGSGVVSEGECY